MEVVAGVVGVLLLGQRQVGIETLDAEVHRRSVSRRVWSIVDAEHQRSTKRSGEVDGERRPGLRTQLHRGLVRRVVDPQHHRPVGERRLLLGVNVNFR